MATEIEIPVSVSLEKGEREDDAFSSEFSEGKVTEHPGNRVKQLESRLNQAVETSSRVAETVNTQPESDKRVDEGGIFFQALSGPVAMADEHVNTPESCETTKTEDREDKRESKIETLTEEKPNDDERVAIVASKETDDNLVDAQEASEQSENGARDKSEQKPVEIEQEEQTEVIMPIVEIDEKLEQKGLLHAITTDTCISTQTKSQVETTEHEQKDDQEATESDDGRKEKSDFRVVKEVCEEAASEKVESENEVVFSDSSSTKLEEKAPTSLNKDDDQEKEQEVNMSEKSQGDDNITNSQDVTLEGDLQKRELVENKEITEKDVPTDVCITTQTEPEEKTPENEEKNEEVIGSDDDQKKKFGNLVVKEVCVESEEVSNLTDDSSIVSNENVIVSKEDEDKVYVSEKGQGGGDDDVTSSQNASSEYIKEKTSQHATTLAYFEGEDLNATPKDILKEEDDRTTDPQEESEQCENEAKDKREPKEESVNKIVHSSLAAEQEDHTEEIKPSDGSLHVITADASNSTQTESHVESAEHEVNNEKATTESDEGVKISDNSSVKQTEETVEILSKNEGQETENEIKSSEQDTISEKVKYEEVKHSDASSTKPDERAITTLCKDEDQESEQKLNVSEKDQGEDGVTRLHDATFEGGLQEKDHESKVNEHEVATTKESTEEDIVHPITTNDCILTQSKPKEETTEENEERIDEENEIVSKDEYQVKEQEIYVSEEGQRGGDDVTSSQNASSEDIKEMIGQDATKVAYIEEVQGLNAMAEDIHKEDATDRIIVPQEASKQYENGANKERKQKPEEYAKEIKPSVETEVKEEQEGLMGISSQTEIQVESQLEAIEHEEEVIESNDGPKEKSNNPSIKEVCEEIDGGKVEYEGVQLSDDSSEKLNEKAIAILSKDEDQEKEQELNIEQDQHEDGVPSSQDATSVEDLEAKNHDSEGQENEVVKTREGIKEDNEEIESSVERKEKVEQEGLLHTITTDVCIITQRNSQEEATESNDDRREKSSDALVKEVCEEVGSENVQSEEGIKLSDSSNIELNEKAIAISSKDEDQENEQELNLQEENQGEEEVTYSREASSEKDLEGKNDDNEHIEPKLVENRESIKEDIEVIRANVDTEEIKEQQGSLSAIVTDVCMSAEREPKEETTKSEESTESYDGREEKLAIPRVNEACEETGLESIDAQEASEPYENEAKDKREQDLEESDSKPVHSHSEIGQAAIKEDETNAGNKEEAYFEKSKFEAGDETECKTADATQNISPENKDETIATESKSTEGFRQDVDMPYDKAGSPLAEETEDEKLNKKEDCCMDSEIQMQKGDANKKADENDFYATHEEKRIDALEQENNICGELQAQVEKEPQEDLRGHQLEDSRSENPWTTEQDILEEVGEKTTMEPEEITKQDFQESQSKTNKEIEAKLDAEIQAGGREDRSEMNDEVVLTEKMSSELEQPMEQNVEEIHACQTTTMSEKMEDDIAEKIKDLSLGSIEDKNDNNIKEEKSFIDGRTREIEISTLEHEPVGGKTTLEPEDITKQAIQEAENQADRREDESEMKDEAVLTEKMSSELEQPMEQNVEEIPSCQTTTVSGKIEDEITEKNEDLSLGNIEDKVDNNVKEEKSFLDEKTREIEISTLEHEPVEEKTTTKSEEITKQAFQESEIETNKDIDTKPDAENQAGEKGDRSEMKDEVVLTEKMSSKLEQPMEQNVEEIHSCQTTSVSGEIEDEITEKNEDLSLGSIEDKNDNNIKEEKSFIDGRTREIEISTLEHEPVEEKTTMKLEEITKQDFQESKIETNKEIDTKLDVGNQADEREDRREMKDEVVLTEKISQELEQPMEQNVEEIPSCQTTTVSGKIEDEITEKNEDLSRGSIKDKDDNTVKEEEESFLNEKTREIEISTLEHEPVEKTTMKSEEIIKQAFQESEIETNKEIDTKLDAENQAGEKEDRSETKDEVVLTEKMPSELEQPMEQNVEEIHSCQTTTVSGEIEDEMTEKNEDLSLDSIEDKDDNTVKEEESFLDEKTREIEISTLEHAPVGEKTTTKSEEITKQAFQESEIKANKEIDTKLDAENQAAEREDRSEMEDKVVLTEKISSELEQPMEQNVEEIQACRTTTMNEKIDDEIAKKDEDLSLGNIEASNDNTTKEEKSFLDGRTREIEISTFEHEPVDEKTTIKPEEITKQAFQESQSETYKEIEAKLDAENQIDETEDKSEMKDEVVLIEKMSSELGQPREINVEKVQACPTTTMSEKTEDEIVENEDLSHDSIKDANENATNEEKSFLDGRTREIEISTLEHEPFEEKNGGLDEVPKKKDTDLNEATTVELQEDFIPSKSTGTSTEDTPNSENSKAESENLPIEDLDSVSEVQIPKVVPKSEDSNLKEECLISATATSVDEERVNVTKEISSDEISYSDPIPVENPKVTEVRVDAQIAQEDLPAEEDINCESKTSSSTQALKMDMKEDAEKSVKISEEMKNDGVDEAPKQERIPTLEDAATLEPQVNLSNIESTQALESVCDVQTPEVVADSEESKVKEESIDLATAEYTDENNGEEEQEIKTNEISSAEKKEQTTESKQVVEPPSTLCPDAVLIEENLEKHEELKPTSELMIDEDQVNETKPQPEQSDITSEQVVVETEKEEGSTEVQRQDFEEDNCPKELEKTSTSNQKELANEIEFSKSIPIGNAEVAEVKAESEREIKNIPEDLSCLSKASSTTEVKDGSVDEASGSERVPNLEDAKALELQVNLPEIESIDTPSNDRVLSSQLTDREILEEEAADNRKEAPNHEFEKDEKDDGLISEIQTPEANLKMEIKEEHLEATNDSCETLTGGLSSEKLLDELKEIDAKEDTEIIVTGEEKVAEDSYQDAVAEVTAHDHLSQTEEKLVSTVPPEELTSPTAEDQTNELVLETDKTKVEHRSISNKDWNPELMEEKFTKTLSEDQRSMEEQHIEEKGQDNFGADDKEAKGGNEVAEDVIVNEVLLEVEKVQESDNINKEGSCIPNQLTSVTDEVCQIKRLNSSPNELVEAKGSVEDIGDPTLMAENLYLKAETFTVMEGPNEDMKQNVEKTSEPVASEFERSENMVTEEKMIEADANKEKKTLDEPQADDAAKTTFDSISTSTEQDKEAKSEEISGHGDMHKLEEETSEVDEIVAEGKEVSAMLTENLQEASPEMLLVKHDPETTTTIEKSEEEIKDKDETLVNMDFSTSSKEVACLSNEEAGEIQVSTLNAEGKQDGPGDMLNKETEAVQPQEHISDIKSVDPPSDVEIREQKELMHCDSQESSEDNVLLSQNDKKTVDLLVLPSVQKETIQCEGKIFVEAPAIDDQKHENDVDYTADARIIDVVSKAKSPEIEQQHLDTKEATVETINQENQSEQKKEEDENIESEIPIEKVPKQTAAHEETANEFLVMPVAKEEEKSNYLQDYSKEEEHSGKGTYQDLEAVTEPSQTDKLPDKVKKAEPIDTQEESIAERNLHEEEIEKRTNITEATVNLHHGEKGDETNCKASSTEAAIPIEYVKSSDMVKGDLDAAVPKCASTRNPEVRSAILEVLSGYNKDPNDKTAEAHVAEKGVLNEDIHLESTSDISKTTEKISGTNQEPFNLPLTKERSMELDTPLTPGTAAKEDVKISQKYVTDDLIKISQIQPELQKDEVSASAADKQLPDKPYQNESKLLTGNIDASHEQGETTAKSLNAKAKELEATNASGTEPQCSSEVVKEEKKISDEKEKSETPKERATIVSTDVLHESTQENSEVAENLIKKRELDPTKDDQVEKEETGDNGAKTDEEDEAEEDDEDNQKMDSCSDAPVMIEASKDMEIKVHKKSHNILSGVGSKVKHSIAKVKKAITGKSSNPKPPSPKGEIK